MKIRPHMSALCKPGAAKGNVVTDPKYNSRLFQPCLREHGVENCHPWFNRAKYHPTISVLL